MTEQNHGDRGIDVNKLVRQDFAKSMRRRNVLRQGFSNVAGSLTGQPRINPGASVLTVDWYRTKLASRGTRKR